LYGRGGADDGYAIYSSITIVKAIQAQSHHGKIVIIIEGSEESGSPDLPYWVDRVTSRIGNVGLVVCLDSGSANYDQFWLTSSLRGVVSVCVKVQVLKGGVHSGSASGIVPSSFRIMRQLLDRVEDSSTGRVLIDEFYTTIPEVRIREAESASVEIGDRIHSEFPFVEGAQPVHTHVPKLLISRTWEPQVAYIAADGFPGLSGGNVMRPYTTIKLSIRLPPLVDSNVAKEALIRELTRDVPYGANVVIEGGSQTDGWSSPPLEPWLETVVQESSQQIFGKPALLFGEGGSIPFMGMLGKKFPEAQFVITGILGPGSNAHGPNEFLHIEYAKGITSCVAIVVERYFHHQ